MWEVYKGKTSKLISDILEYFGSFPISCLIFLSNMISLIREDFRNTLFGILKNYQSHIRHPHF